MTINFTKNLSHEDLIQHFVSQGLSVTPTGTRIVKDQFIIIPKEATFTADEYNRNLDRIRHVEPEDASRHEDLINFFSGIHGQYAVLTHEQYTDVSNVEHHTTSLNFSGKADKNILIQYGLPETLMDDLIYDGIIGFEPACNLKLAKFRNTDNTFKMTFV